MFGIEENVELKHLVQMRVGGPARFFVSARSREDLKEAVSFAKSKNVSFFVLGEGSNIIVSDKGFNGLVIKMEIGGIEYKDRAEGMEVIAGGGLHWDTVVADTVSKNLSGLENLSLIPGTVGAAAVQNIGAYGAEIEQSIQWVEVFDTTIGEFKQISHDACGFNYRTSIYKHERKDLIVARVSLLLNKNAEPNIGYKDVKTYFEERNNPHPSISEVRNAVIEIRRAKLPYDGSVGTVGSFFKNPIVPEEKAAELLRLYPELPLFPAHVGFKKISLAWIIEHICGIKKGHREGNVGVYKNHALAIVSYDHATAREVLSFAKKIQDAVSQKIGIMPECEVLFVGEF